MQIKFDITKATAVTTQDLAILVSQLRKNPTPDEIRKNPTLHRVHVHDYICGQMQIVHKFFVAKLGNNRCGVHHVIDWMIGQDLLDPNNASWLYVNATMTQVVALAETCSTILLRSPKQKTTDVSYSWTGRNDTGIFS